MRVRAIAAMAAAALTLTTGCSALGGETDKKDEASGTVVIATHDSWNMSKDVIARFERESGLKVKIQPQGDAGQLTNKLVLTKGNPIADAVYGIDNTFASRAVDEGVLAHLEGSAEDAVVEEYAAEQGAGQLLPVDYSDVCVNIDDAWFAKEKLAPPKTLDDLTKPAYEDLFVTPGASSSSPGLAFLLATVGQYGDAWPAYWRKLMGNGAKITSGWTDAYTVDFTASGKGDRPIVLSYSSSPPFTIPEGKSQPTTSALLDTCFRQVEYAGVLDGADNPDGAQEFIAFLLEEEFQAALPDNMYVYPVTDVTIPEAWAKWAPRASTPLTVPAEDIASNRAAWLQEWRDIATG